jgi:hypothetical protein
LSKQLKFYVICKNIFCANIFPQGVRYIPDQIIIKYKIGQSPDELQNAGKIEDRRVLLLALSNVGVLSQKRLYASENSLLENYYILTLKPGFTVPDAYNRLTKIPEIENAAPDYILKIQETPNDPYYPSMWNLSRIEVEKAWNQAHVDGKVTIAVIDTGVDYQHEDLRDVVIKGKNFISNDNNPMDDQGHGTHVAGIAAATTNNGIGISGATWGAKILAIKACDKNGDCSTANVSKAIQYAVDNNAKIVNVSIAGSGSCNGTYTDVLRYAGEYEKFLGDEFPADLIPDIPKKKIASIDGYGNIKTTMRLSEITYKPGQKLLMKLNTTSHLVTFSDGVFNIAEGETAFAPGSSGYNDRFMEIFVRGGSAFAQFGKPHVEQEFEIVEK